MHVLPKSNYLEHVDTYEVYLSNAKLSKNGKIYVIKLENGRKIDAIITYQKKFLAKKN